MVRDEPLIFCPSRDAGFDIARKLGKAFGWQLVENNHKGTGRFASSLREAFSLQRPIIGVCAAGILVRSLAPVIGNKMSDPPVICISPSGANVIPLLGGHHGANDLALKIANVLDANLALTTAGDVLLGVSLDEPPEGWRLENPPHVKDVTAAILANQPTIVRGACDWLHSLLGLENVSSTPSESATPTVKIEVSDLPPLCYHQQNLAVGVGCIRNCPSEHLRDHVFTILSQSGLSPFAVQGIYSIDIKSDEAAVHDLAKDLGVPARFFTPEQLNQHKDRLKSPSEVVYQETGCYGVCEGAALAASSSEGKLIIPKQTAQGVTCAIAKIGSSGNVGGMPRGTLMIVGLGPGAAEYRTIEAHRMLGVAEDIVGYSGYVDNLNTGVTAGRQLFKFDLGEEAKRCQFALERAGEGRRVALVSSGDAGIYAMASLVYEILETGGQGGELSEQAARVEIVCAPGISAMQMASAKVGALLGHDFCAISLSDLLTPRETIVGRIEAAAIGDFVIAFYNPVSLRRKDLLVRAKEILLAQRPPDTPVLIARNLARDEEKITLIALSDLQPELVDMLTMVIVGNSQTRSTRSADRLAGIDGHWLYTPRGYAKQVRAS